MALKKKSKSTSLKLNNNLLSGWDGLRSTLLELFVDPAKTLGWIDLSFNDLKTIDEVKEILQKFKRLYLLLN